MAEDERVDREAILARRALFMASALAALGGCSPRSPPVELADHVAPQASASSSARELPPIGEPPSLAALRPWQELYTGAPSLEAGGDLPPEMEKLVAELRSRIEATYAMTAIVQQSLPSWCPFERSQCDREWRQFTRELAIVAARVADLGDRCGPGPDTPYNRLRRAHHEYLSAIVGPLATRALSQVESWRAEKRSVESYIVMWTEAQRAAPRTCLSCVGSADDLRSLDPILFSHASAKISPASLPVLEQLRARIAARPEMKLELQGNASASEGSESEERALALRRAQAVRSWLVAQGVDEARLSVVSLGSTRPVGRETSAEERALNRGVQIRVFP